MTSDGVYVSYSGPQTYKFNPTTGALIWHYSGLSEGGGGSDPAYYAGMLYVRSLYSVPFDKEMAVFNASNGQVITSLLTTTPTIPAFYNGLGFVQAGGALEAFNPTSGIASWNTTSVADPFVTAPIVINGIVFEGTASGIVYGFNCLTGTEVSMFSLDTPITGSSGPETGLGAGDGLLVVPAGDTLSAYSMIPEPSSAVLGITAFAWILALRKSHVEAQCAAQVH